MAYETENRIQSLERQVAQLYMEVSALLLISSEHNKVLMTIAGSTEELQASQKTDDTMSDLASQIEKARMAKTHLS